MAFKLDKSKINDYIKICLIAILLAVEIVVCAQAYTLIGDDPLEFISLIVCCAALAVLEGVNLFAIKNFAAKMVFYGFDSALLLTICVLTGNSFLAALYCIVLTGCYMSVERFKDRTALFGTSCVLFVASFIVGWVIQHRGENIYFSVVEILSGVLFGLLAIVLNYIIVQFLIKFTKTNRELREAIKLADEKNAEAEAAREQLMRTKVYEERNRIARDIHDNAGHSLTTVIMQTEAAKLIIEENPAEAKNRIIFANIQAKNALEQLRESVHLLAGRQQVRPLREELGEIIAQTIDGTDIRARYDISDVKTNGEQYRYICNAVKELLANGVRHGNATAFYIELKQTDGKINLLVSDNGSGVDGEVGEGFGLKGIRERAEALGGGCRYSSEADEGFETEIYLPHAEEEEEND
ncbi:MAG: hypothetical protein K2L67_02485 [Clostridia bacterium]|nr:hypothetical protein [Clostridia bacterium]